MLEGPTIAQELGAEVPLFCPIRLQALSSLFIPNDGPVIFASQQVESTNVDKGITTKWMFGEVGEVQWDCERVLKRRAASGEIWLNAIRSRRIDPHIVLNCGPHVFRSFWMALFSDNKVTPLRVKCGESAREGSRGVKVIEVCLLVEALQGGTEHRARMEINARVGGPEAEDILVIELLGTAPEAVDHSGVNMGGEDCFRLH
jgi:hypothetical protein